MSIEDFLKTEIPYLTDGGLETTFIFHQGFDLPFFASFPLIETDHGRATLHAYFTKYIALAARAGRGFLLDTVTWRANTAWGREMGLPDAQILRINEEAVTFARSIRDAHSHTGVPIVINGVTGPAGDGYAPTSELTSEEALEIHAPQIQALARAGADLITALTLTHSGEAIGIALAAQEVDIPAVISFTVETDGRLPSGQPLGEAIAEVDTATIAYPIHYMINCAHPDHFRGVISVGEVWTTRIGGLRTNASRMSHAELDAAEELDEGNPAELGHLHRELLALLPNIRVLGGCCGTDHRHVGCIAGAHTRTRAA